MDRRRDIDASLCRQTTRQPHHVGPVGVVRKVTERTRVGVGANADRSAKHGMEPIHEHVVGLGTVRPTPGAG
jgi:hypothetical protein